MFATHRLPDQVDVTFGPHAVIARFILQGDRATRERGVYLSLEHDFDALVKFNETQTDSWYPLIPIFDPRVSDLRPGNSFWIAGRNEKGEIVATQCARLFDWRNSNFEREFEALRLAYEDPDTKRLPEESGISGVRSGKRITGLVCYSGGGWYRPDYRGRALSAIVPRLSRTIAYTRWNSDYTISLVEPVLVEKGVTARYGYTRIENGIDWLNSFRGDLRNICLIWMDRRELIDDLTDQLAHRGDIDRRRHA